MGWNPQINFKLRDDEITFGDLIFDKGSAELLCKALTAIKNGQSVGNDVIKSIIENGCYTDKELEAIRKEFDEIKNDISYFKKLRASGFTSGVSNWAKRVDANINYVTGSNTWIEKYKELKLCACEMYESLLGKNYAFTPQEKTTFDKRYGDVLKSTTSKERLDGVLRKQYYEDLEAGVPNAADIYIQAQVDNGIITEQQAEGKRKLFGAASKSVVKTDLASDFEGDTFGVYSADGKEIGIHVEDTTGGAQTVTVTRQLLMDKLNQIKGISDFKDKALAGMTLYKYVKSALVEAGVNTDKADLALENFIKVQNVPMGELFTVLSATISQVDTSAIGTLFDSLSYEVNKSDWDSIVKTEKKSRDTFELNCKTLESMIKQIQGITDFGKSGTASVVLLKLVQSVFTEANAAYPAGIDEVNKTNMTFGETVKSTVAVVNEVISTSRYSAVIDNCHKEIDTSWWNRQLQ